MINRATFTVIIPTFNRQRLLIRAIQSINFQKKKPTEVIIVDNEPNGNNKKIFLFAKKKFNLNLRYLFYGNKKNVLKSRNFASKFVKSSHIAFLDDDDYWHKDYLLWAFNTINRNKSKLIISEYNVMSNKKKKIFTFHIPKKIDYQSIFRWNPGILCSNMIIERSTFHKIKMFDDQVFSSADKDILIKCINNKIKYSIIKKPLVNWTYHKNQWSQNNSLIIDGVTMFHKKYFKEMNLLSKIISIKKIFKLKLLSFYD